MNKQQYSKKLFELSQIEGIDKKILSEATEAYIKGDFKRIDQILVKLTPDYQLLEALISKLKGKSVYNGLKRLIEGKDTSLEQAGISTASLIVHCLLELKDNRREYTKLLPDLHTKLGIIIQKLRG